MIDRADERTGAGSGTRTPPSRLFFSSKVSRAERDAGCGHLPAQDLDLFPNAQHGDPPPAAARNPHPTVKPIALMRWLVRLSSPPGGLVLDPFCGSGSTGAATVLEDRRFIGIERENTYVQIARARIAHHAPTTSGRCLTERTSRPLLPRARRTG
jgi:site-specific DNA-methyltransferase (adenine-specific)